MERAAQAVPSGPPFPAVFRTPPDELPAEQELVRAESFAFRGRRLAGFTLQGRRTVCLPQVGLLCPSTDLRSTNCS